MIYPHVSQKGHSFSLWQSQAWCFSSNTQETHKHTTSTLHEPGCRLLPSSVERFDVCLWNLKEGVLCTYFLRIGEFGHCLLKKSPQMLEINPLKMNCGAAVYICHWYEKIKHLKPLFTYLSPCRCLCYYSETQMKSSYIQGSLTKQPTTFSHNERSSCRGWVDSNEEAFAQQMKESLRGGLILASHPVCVSE